MAPVLHPSHLPFHKTRIAPTPSGYLHLGNVLSFIITATLARKYQASTLLRIDDMDRQRIRNEYVSDIFDSLHFLNIPWQEGPVDGLDFENNYSQLVRMKLYRDALEYLRSEGLVFACNCSRGTLATKGTVYDGACLNKNLELDMPGVCWRLRTDPALILSVNTLTANIQTSLPEDQHYFIVRKKDGFPAYQLSSLVDDVHFGIDLIVRGADLWQSTLAQLYLAELMQQSTFRSATFYHHALLLGSSGQKLSKSAGDTSVRYLREQGIAEAGIYERLIQITGINGHANNWEQLGTLLLQQLPEYIAI